MCSSDLDAITIKKQWMDLHYTKGAVLSKVERKNLNKSQLSRLASLPIYQKMTVRNVNTTRKLFQLMKQMHELSA